MRFDQHGEPVDTPKSNTKAPAKQEKRTDLILANQVLESLKQPVVFSCGEFWGFSVRSGWTTITEQVSRRAARAKQTNPEKTLLPLLQILTKLPSSNTQESVYWERIENEWHPLEVGPNEVVFTDQILNVVTNESQSLTGRIVYGPMVSLRWEIDSDAEEPACPEFLEMIERAIPSPAVRSHFQEVCSVVLQPHMGFRGQVVLWGQPYTGKTTIATAIGCVPAGRSGISQVQEEELVRDKFILSALANRFINVSDDSARTNRWTSFMKRYTSGSMVMEVKFHQPESMTPTAKLFSTCNEIPWLVDASGAATDRLFAFRFDHPLPKVAGSPNDAKMSVRYWSAPERRAGILSWLMAGLVSLRTRGRFSPPKEWEESLVQAKAKADDIASTLLDGLEIGGEDDFVSTDDILSLFITGGLSKAGQNAIPDYIARLFPEAEKSRSRLNGSRLRGYKKLKLA